MNKSMSIFACLLLSAFPGSMVFAEDKDSDKWDVNNPPYPTHEIPLDVTSGTWMNLDVSPDGRWIAFLSDVSGRYEVSTSVRLPDSIDGDFFLLVYVDSPRQKFIPRSVQPPVTSQPTLKPSRKKWTLLTISTDIISNFRCC